MPAITRTPNYACIPPSLHDDAWIMHLMYFIIYKVEIFTKANTNTCCFGLYIPQCQSNYADVAFWCCCGGCSSRDLWGVSIEHHHTGIIVNQCALCRGINSWSPAHLMLTPAELKIYIFFKRKGILLFLYVGTYLFNLKRVLFQFAICTKVVLKLLSFVCILRGVVRLTGLACF